MGGEVRNPRRTLPRAILISAPLIAAAYVLGTGALLRLVPKNDVSIVSGFLQGIDVGARTLAPGLAWLAPLAVLGPTIVLTRSLGATLAAGVAAAAALGLWARPLLRRRPLGASGAMDHPVQHSFRRV